VNVDGAGATGETGPGETGPGDTGLGDIAPDSPWAAIDFTVAPRADAGRDGATGAAFAAREQPADRWAHRRAEPRALAVFWLMYLTAAFAVAIGGSGASALVAFDVYRQVGRTMLVLTAIGMCVLWPMVRLSQSRPERPWRGMWQDVLVIAGPVVGLCAAQSAPWLADWPVMVAVAVCATMAAWALAIGALIACAQSWDWPRAAAMALCLVVGAGGALFALRPSPVADGSAGERVEVRRMLSAATATLEMTGDRSWTGSNASVEARHWFALLPPGVVAVACAVGARGRPHGVRASGPS